MFWNYDNTLSHNCLFNFIIGDRGAGKTYGAKKRAIQNFKKNGSEFIYLRRYKSELEDIKSFFTDLVVNNEFPDDTLKVEGKKFYINDKLFGYAVALSTANKKKSTAFPKVSLIIYDEFIVEKQILRYLTNEVGTFQDFYVTVSRYRPVQVLFLANAITMQNPYFLHYDIYLPHGKNIFKKNDILLEMVENLSFKNHVKSTRVGQMLMNIDKDYSKYAIDNEFLLDNRTFVEKKPPFARHNFNIIFKGLKIGIWADWVNGILYVSNDLDPSNGLTFAITNEDHNPNTLLIKRLSSNNSFKTFIDAYKLGAVRFENIRIKGMCNDMFKMLIK